MFPAARTSTLQDRLTAEAIAAAFPGPALAAGREAAETGYLSRTDLRADRAEGIVAADDRIARRVTLAAEGRGLQSSCSCGEPRCVHAAAFALMLLGERPVEPEAEAEEAPASLREEERRRRAARGATETFELERLGGKGLFGTYEVASPSAQAYRVVIRALDAPHNGCSCPDFATNLLGTCKHVEAVLHRLRRDAPRRWAKALADGAPASYLHLRFELDPTAGDVETIGVRLGAGAGPAERRFAARHFSPGGLLLGPLAAAWPEVARDAVEAGVEIPPEVTRLADRADAGERREKRRRAVESEVRAAGCEQPGLRVRLYPYQVEGVAFLAGRGRALLADEMGLGKTAQAIAASVLLARRGEVRRTLVVCPASLKHQWHREFRQFTDLAEADVVVVGGSREERRARYAEAPPVLITSYELARADERELVDLGPDLLVLDEAQRVKNWRTRTASVVKRIRSRFAFVLTGTPLENRLDDLYSLMQVVDPQLFGPLWRFNEEFTRLDPTGRPSGYKHLDRLRACIAPAVLRRRKEEVLADLPERLVSRLVVPMTAEQRAAHDEAEAVAARLSAILRRRALNPGEEQRLLRAFQRMRMACDAAALVSEAAAPAAPKLEELERLLEEICLSGGHKVVVFSEWERMQALAAEVCERLELPHVRLHGGVPTADRGPLIDRFRDDPACKVFLATDAGGLGLNLQAASHVVNLDLPWNPATLAQRIARVHRLGQREAVNVVLLVSEGSFEERLEASLDGKRALFSAAVGDDAETTDLERPSLARRLAAVLQGGEAAGSAAAPATAAAARRDPLAALRERAGDALEQVLRLADGRLLGVVRGEVPAGEGLLAPRPGSPTGSPRAEAAGDEAGALLLPAHAVAALEALGLASPLSGAETVFRAPLRSDDPRRAARRDLAGLAERKRTAGEALLAAGQPAEALVLLGEAVGFACRALDPRGDPGAEPAALLAAIHGHLVPAGLLAEGEAAAAARAAQAARAFAAATVAPPPALVAVVAGDARALVARARAGVDG